nr:hypothetical protein XAC3615_4420008 [Xanthomonas citri pv. citri]
MPASRPPTWNWQWAPCTRAWQQARKRVKERCRLSLPGVGPGTRIPEGATPSVVRVFFVMRWPEGAVMRV